MLDFFSDGRGKKSLPSFVGIRGVILSHVEGEKRVLSVTYFTEVLDQISHDCSCQDIHSIVALRYGQLFPEKKSTPWLSSSSA